MITITFRCPKGHEFDIPARTNQRPPTNAACPVCMEIATQRIWAAPTVVYKGDGWTGAGKRNRDER